MRPLLVICSILAACAGCESSEEHWAGTWTASMVESGSTLQDQTVRQVAHISIGGDRLRVALSHAFGTEQATVSMASVGLRAEGATVASGTLQPLTFDGNRSVEIAPGASVVSDPVELEVGAQSDLVVSVFVDGTGAESTVHPDSYQTNYIADGNFVDALDMPDDQTETCWYWLSGIDVQVSQPPRVVVAFGDSLTEGSESTVDANARYPDVLARELASAGDATAVLNAGIGGNRVLTDSVEGFGHGPGGLARFDRDVLSQPGATHVVVLEGTNDLGTGALLGPVVTAEQVISAYETMVESAHGEGLTIWFGTILPFRGAAALDFWSEENEQKRQTINGWIRTTDQHDGFIDFDQALRDPDDPEQLLPAYDSGDHLHPSDAGYQRMGEVGAEALR